MCYNELVSFLKQQTTETDFNIESINLKEITKFLKSPYELIYCVACDYLKQDEYQSGIYSLTLNGAAKYTVKTIFNQMDT